MRWGRRGSDQREGREDAGKQKVGDHVICCDHAALDRSCLFLDFLNFGFSLGPLGSVDVSVELPFHLLWSSSNVFLFLSKQQRAGIVWTSLKHLCCFAKLREGTDDFL